MKFEFTEGFRERLERGFPESLHSLAEFEFALFIIAWECELCALYEHHNHWERQCCIEFGFGWLAVANALSPRNANQAS